MRRIFYHFYDNQRASGGQKHTYEHVDILNRNGFEAYVWHTAEGYRLQWFENETSVVGQSDFERLFDPRTDVVVLPENLGEEIRSYPGRKIVFDKNVYLGCRSVGPSTTPHPYHDPSIIGLFAVSEHNAALLRCAFPRMLVQRVYPSINPQVFRFQPWQAKQPRITWILKSPGQTLALYHVLRARASQGLNVLAQFEWSWLGDMTESEVSQVLQQSLIFVCLHVDEGLGRMVLEAMSCGCIVIAFGSGPLRETLPIQYQVEYGDLLGSCERVERIAAAYPRGLQEWASAVEAGLTKCSEYAPARQENSVLCAWDSVLRAI
jgi:hypothetical protein